VGKTPPITHVKSAEEGLLVSLNQRGTVDIAYIAALYGKPEEQVLSELGDLIFRNPESNNWETADAYLSGNVREKLAAAERAGPAFVRNADTLRAVQPRGTCCREILTRDWARRGYRWTTSRHLPPELFHVEPSSVPVAHLPKDAVWNLDADFAAEASVAATSDYGTPRANGTWLLDLALNMKTPVIYDTIQAGGHEEKVVNPEETLAAREKQKLIKERFRCVGVHRPAPHRAARAALQRHLQQSAAQAVRMARISTSPA